MPFHYQRATTLLVEAHFPLVHKLFSLCPSRAGGALLHSISITGRSILLQRSAASTTAAATHPSQLLSRKRNIGISAHIDSGKTTLTERILYYAGKIKAIHEVRGNDGVGAKMDSMELEREKGITIQSAATNCSWSLDKKVYNIDIIDTPGHVDFTIEVERALRVLDGGVLLCCAVAGVQSQTLTVNRQMERYQIPRILFINKLDRDGADPDRALQLLRSKLSLCTAALQVPIGIETKHKGIIEVIPRKVYYFDGPNGEILTSTTEIPKEYVEKTLRVRKELMELLADIDDAFAELYIEGEENCTEEAIYASIRRCTIARTFCPLLMGSARSNKGVQLLIDAICRYLPSPSEVTNYALDQDENEAEITLNSDYKSPLIGLAFKIQDLPIGQTTYLRIYQGSLKKGDALFNTLTGKRMTAKRLLKMHADESKDCDVAVAGDIVAITGIDCSSGTTFTDGRLNYSLHSMFVPDSVISWSIQPKANTDAARFTKALSRFQREDPTFRVHVDPESKETVMSGMGELQLSIYVERMKREYGLEVHLGEPKVNYREIITQSVDFEYLHKKQSGGAGQYGKVMGTFEPISDDVNNLYFGVVFENRLMGNQISPNHIQSVEKGFRECSMKGLLTGSPVINIRFVLKDGLSHVMDSSDVAFRAAAAGAFREFYSEAAPVVLEPLMRVEVLVPAEFQSAGLTSLIKRRATINSSSTHGDTVLIEATVGLKDMFGYISDLRASTQGQGEFTMEFEQYAIMNAQDQGAAISKYAALLAAKNKSYV